MAKKPKVNSELSELEAVSNEEVISDSVSETVEDEVENFKLYLVKMTADLLILYKSAIDVEISKRRHFEIDKVATFFKTLPLEEQQIFLESIKATTSSKQNLANLDEKKPKKEKNPLRMYQDFKNDEDIQFKVAPMVNMELKEIFTGGNPNNKSWLMNLSLQERYEHFGTMKKLEQNSDYLYELMTVQKAVFKCEDGEWIDCYQ